MIQPGSAAGTDCVESSSLLTSASGVSLSNATTPLGARRVLERDAAMVAGMYAHGCLSVCVYMYMCVGGWVGLYRFPSAGLLASASGMALSNTTTPLGARRILERDAAVFGGMY